METIRSLPLFDKESNNSDNLNVTEQRRKTQDITDALRAIFPEQEQEDKAIKKAKQILGNLSNQLEQNELKILLSEIQYLSESWLDIYEKELFSGNTLSELLNEV